MAVITEDPTSTSDLYDRVGYPTLARLGLIPYPAFREALATLAAAGAIEGHTAPDGATMWRRTGENGGLKTGIYSVEMLVFGLVHGDGWDPPEEPWEPGEDDLPERRPWTWHLPWRPFAWLAVWCWLMALVPIVTSAAGGLAGFGVLMLAIGLACWRLERFCARQYWGGLREYKY
jgi:hypothetical protein